MKRSNKQKVNRWLDTIKTRAASISEKLLFRPRRSSIPGGALAQTARGWANSGPEDARGEADLSSAWSIAVDFPKQNENIFSRCYTVRISAPENAKGAEVRIDHGDWRPCREAVGHWWYDWSNCEPGRHEASARAKTREGETIRSKPVEFLVVR